MTTLQAARHYQDMVFRWLRAKRDFPFSTEPPPEPPARLERVQAQSIFEACEREFARGSK